MRIRDGSSIFTAEAKAIDLALDLVDNCNSHDKFIIFSDSFSVLQALNHTSSKNQQIQNILQKHHTISKYKTIVYCWIPSHIGVRNNERVDKQVAQRATIAHLSPMCQGQISLQKIRTHPSFNACSRYMKVSKGSNQKQHRKSGNTIFPIISLWGYFLDVQGQLTP